jgi:hypothetical protein
MLAGIGSAKRAVFKPVALPGRLEGTEGKLLAYLHDGKV